MEGMIFIVEEKEQEGFGWRSGIGWRVYGKDMGMNI